MCIVKHFVPGAFRYTVSEHRWTQMLTSSVEEGSTPSPRYHHAAALLTTHESVGQGASHNFMLVVGGVTQKGVAMDTWSLNLSSLVWREHKVRIKFVVEKKNIEKMPFASSKSNFFPPPDRAQCCHSWLAIL